MMPDILHLKYLWFIMVCKPVVSTGGKGRGDFFFCGTVKMTTGRNEGRNCKLAVRSKQKADIVGTERKDPNEICLRECEDVLFFADEVTCRRVEEHQQEQNVPKVPWDAAHRHGPLTPK